jgi:hypothetical protein
MVSTKRTVYEVSFAVLSDNSTAKFFSPRMQRAGNRAAKDKQ